MIGLTGKPSLLGKLIILRHLDRKHVFAASLVVFSKKDRQPDTGLKNPAEDVTPQVVWL
jgi:hypothetical protein